MNIPTEHHVIRYNDIPVAVVVPYEEYIMAFHDDDVTMPHEVVKRAIHVSLTRAWREYLGLTQAEVASRMGITQPAYSQMEEKGSKLRFTTLQKIAKALDIDVQQLYL